MDLNELSSKLKHVPDDYLMKEMKTPTGMAPPYLVMAEVNRRRQARSDFGTEKPKTLYEDLMSPPQPPMQGPPPGQGGPPGGPPPGGPQGPSMHPNNMPQGPQGPPQQAPVPGMAMQGQMNGPGYADGGGVQGYADGGLLEILKSIGRHAGTGLGKFGGLMGGAPTSARTPPTFDPSLQMDDSSAPGLGNMIPAASQTSGTAGSPQSSTPGSIGDVFKDKETQMALMAIALTMPGALGKGNPMGILGSIPLIMALMKQKGQKPAAAGGDPLANATSGFADMSDMTSGSASGGLSGMVDAGGYDPYMTPNEEVKARETGTDMSRMMEQGEGSMIDSFDGIYPAMDPVTDSFDGIYPEGGMDEYEKEIAAMGPYPDSSRGKVKFGQFDAPAGNLTEAMEGGPEVATTGPGLQIEDIFGDPFGSSGYPDFQGGEEPSYFQGSTDPMGVGSTPDEIPLPLEEFSPASAEDAYMNRPLHERFTDPRGTQDRILRKIRELYGGRKDGGLIAHYARGGGVRRPFVMGFQDRGSVPDLAEEDPRADPNRSRATADGNILWRPPDTALGVGNDQYSKMMRWMILKQTQRQHELQRKQAEVEQGLTEDRTQARKLMDEYEPATAPGMGTLTGEAKGIYDEFRGPSKLDAREKDLEKYLGEVNNLRPNVNQALITAGLGALASESPHAGVGIGRGGLAGMKQYLGQKTEHQAARTKYEEMMTGLARSQDASDRTRASDLTSMTISLHNEKAKEAAARNTADLAQIDQLNSDVASKSQMVTSMMKTEGDTMMGYDDNLASMMETELEGQYREKVANIQAGSRGGKDDKPAHTAAHISEIKREFKKLVEDPANAGMNATTLYAKLWETQPSWQDNDQFLSAFDSLKAAYVERSQELKKDFFSEDVPQNLTVQLAGVEMRYRNGDQRYYPADGSAPQGQRRELLEKNIPAGTTHRGYTVPAGAKGVSYTDNNTGKDYIIPVHPVTEKAIGSPVELTQ